MISLAKNEEYITNLLALLALIPHLSRTFLSINYETVYTKW